MPGSVPRIFFALVALALLTASPLAGQSERRVPTVDDLLNVKSAGGARISPDGKWVAYTVTETNFKTDAYVTQIWLADAATGRTLQLTRGEKSSGGPRWSPDGEWLAFTSDRVGDRNQLFAIRPGGGEAVQLTKSETPVGGFTWSEDGKRIAYLATEPVPQAMKDRKEHLGDFEVVRREYTHLHNWTLDVAEALAAPVVG
jgi:dipeptidyl aminopeptidase/acylaminoacyl peptidase